MKSFLLACLLTTVGFGTAMVQDPPSPTPIAFTPEPRQLHWRIGFDLGNAVVLETPELNPKSDLSTAMREADRLLPDPLLTFGLALLPASKVAFQTDRLVNPRHWTILDFQGKTERKTFQALGVFMGTRMTSSEGGYHLVSIASMPDNPFVGLRKEPSGGDLLFGFAGNLKGKPQIHTKLSETKWENLLPVEDPANLPPGYMTAKTLLDDHASEDHQRFLYGTSIEAMVGKRLTKLWLLNYSHPNTTIGRHPWGIFQEQAGDLKPLYIYNPSPQGDPYVAYFTAAVDLNQDGTDELLVEASYRIGTAYKVISNVGGKFEETFTSYYRGPIS
jgi:hypothetical protein